MEPQSGKPIGQATATREEFIEAIFTAVLSLSQDPFKGIYAIHTQDNNCQGTSRFLGELVRRRKACRYKMQVGGMLVKSGVKLRS